MKKLKEILVIATMITGLFSSCAKNQDLCCYTNAYDNINDRPVEYKDCRSNASKKEIEKFKSNNTALSSYNNIHNDFANYEDVTYSCK